MGAGQRLLSWRRRVEWGGIIVQPPTGPTMTPVLMQEVWHHTGINTKSTYGAEPSGYTSGLIDACIELNCYIVRENPATGGSAARQLDFMEGVLNTGMAWHMTTVEREFWPNWGAAHSDVLSFLTSDLLPRLTRGGTNAQKATLNLHSFGGANEIDEAAGAANPGPTGGGNPLRTPAAIAAGDWYGLTYDEQSDLATRVRASAVYGNVPIASVSTRTDFEQYPSRGDLMRGESARPGGLWDDITDYVNIHRYYSGEDPGRNIDASLQAMVDVMGDYPSIASETGSNDAHYAHNIQATLPRDVCADYLVRGLFDFYQRGCISIWFQLLDRPNYVNFSTPTTVRSTVVNSDHWGMYGMAHNPPRNSGETTAQYAARLKALNTPGTWIKKPQLWAVKRLNNLLRDDDADASPPSLDPFGIEITAGADVRKLLMKRADGTHWLALWRPVEPYKFSRTGTSTYQSVTSTSVTVRLEDAATVAVYRPAGVHSEQPNPSTDPTITTGTDTTFPAAALSTGANNLNGGALGPGDTFRVNVGRSLLLASIT